MFLRGKEYQAFLLIAKKLGITTMGKAIEVYKKLKEEESNGKVLLSA